MMANVILWEIKATGVKSDSMGNSVCEKEKQIFFTFSKYYHTIQAAARISAFSWLLQMLFLLRAREQNIEGLLALRPSSITS